MQRPSVKNMPINSFLIQELRLEAFAKKCWYAQQLAFIWLFIKSLKNICYSYYWGRFLSARMQVCVAVYHFYGQKLQTVFCLPSVFSARFLDGATKACPCLDRERTVSVRSDMWRDKITCGVFTGEGRDRCETKSVTLPHKFSLIHFKLSTRSL